MDTSVESTERKSTDYFHFGVMFLGFLIGAAGVVTLSRGATLCGLVLIAFGLAYFLLENG